MAQVTDPVCGMVIDSDAAAGKSRYEDGTFYFCSTECLERFESDPARYASTAKTLPVEPHADLERHEAPHTKAGGIVAPKFGSAGSGGAEYERLPEAHEDREGRA